MEKKSKRIVVMGGSFNPPTLAHYKLMKTALDAVDADLGFYTPVSDAYLKRKMARSDFFMVLSPEVRVKMLETMCTDVRMKVWEKEIGTVMARTVDTLQEIKDDYPDAEIYFIMGDDKLSLLVHMAEKSAFLDRFKVVLYSREYTSDELRKILESNETINGYEERIVVIPQPEGIDMISSSLIRERMLAREGCEELLYSGVWELLKEYGPFDFPDVILRFKGDNSFLSNAFNCKFTWRGMTYRSADAAFKAAESSDRENLEVMESILRAKFEDNPYLMKKLVETGNAVLINGNNRKEEYWGIDLYSWRGENNLGKILMKIRDKEE
ncbi:MAG: DUF1768 domain-containing protein [Bacteroidales bacterium]|nr:DUF1768 domain-containing protein [Bacteroidales bacterium]